MFKSLKLGSKNKNLQKPRFDNDKSNKSEKRFTGKKHKKENDKNDGPDEF